MNYGILYFLMMTQKTLTDVVNLLVPKRNPKFTGTIKGTFKGNLQGNASTATKATQDSDGNIIINTYATKAELANKLDKNASVASAIKATRDGSGNIITDTYATKATTYTRDQIDSKVASVYKYKGSVAKYSDLPIYNRIIGDVWDVQSDGANYAWNGSVWDKLGGNVDLSDYMKTTTANTTFATKSALTSGLAGKLGLHDTADAAVKAYQDGNGKVITSTYATKEELNNAHVSASSSWEDIENKPEFFPPSAHTHISKQIVDLPNTIKSYVVPIDNRINKRIQGIETKVNGIDNDLHSKADQRSLDSFGDRLTAVHDIASSAESEASEASRKASEIQLSVSDELNQVNDQIKENSTTLTNLSNNVVLRKDDRGILAGYESTGTIDLNSPEKIHLSSADSLFFDLDKGCTISFDRGYLKKTATKVITLHAKTDVVVTFRMTGNDGAEWVSGNAPKWGSKGKTLVLVAHWVAGVKKVLLSVFYNDENKEKK